MARKGLITHSEKKYPYFRCLFIKKKKSIVPPKIIQKTTAIGDMIYTAYILAHKIYIISGNNFLFWRPLKVDKH